MTEPMKPFLTEDNVWGPRLGYIKINLDGHVKYLRYHEKMAGTPTGANLVATCVPWGPDNALAFHELPLGDWNVGELIWDEAAHGYALKALLSEQLPSIPSWHPVHIDYSELPDYDQLEDDHTQLTDELIWTRDESGTKQKVFAASNESTISTTSTRINVSPPQLCMERSHYRKPCLTSDLPVVVHYIWEPDWMEWLCENSEVRAIVDGHNIAPKFLAHLTENHHRVIGFVEELVPNARRPVKSDFPACRAVLQSFHDLGWAFESEGVEESIFMIGEDGKAYIEFFSGASPCKDPKQHQSNMDDLRTKLDKLDSVPNLVQHAGDSYNVAQPVDQPDARSRL